jgi:hypothetical protein
MVYEFWRERAEPLLSRWPTIIVLLTQWWSEPAPDRRAAHADLTHHDFFRSPTFAVMAFGRCSTRSPSRFCFCR